MEDGHDEMYCPSCGERMRRDANFCRHCGERNGKRERADWGPDAGSTATDATPDDQHTGTVETGGYERAPDPGGQFGPEPSPGTGRGPTAAGRSSPSEDTDTSGMSQWRANLPLQIRASDESSLRTVGVAVGLAAASILVPVIVGAILGAMVLAAVQPGDIPDTALIGGLVVLVVAQFAWFVGFGLWYLKRRGLDRARIVSYLGVARPSGKQLALVVGTAIVMLVAQGVLSQVLVTVLEQTGLVENVQPAENESADILENNPSPLLLVGGIAFMFLVVGPAEELLFRGVIQGRLRERLSAPAAIGVASVVFGSVHLFALGGGSGLAGLVTTITVLSVVAVALGTLYEYTGNIVVPALTHGLYNSILIVGLYVTVTTDSATLLPALLPLCPV